MKPTFERAKRIVELFNENKALTQCDSPVFFANAGEMICRVDGQRISDVIPSTTSDHGDVNLMVLEVTDAKGKRQRLMALWARAESQGRVVWAKNVPPAFKLYLKMEPSATFQPATMARQEVASSVVLALVPHYVPEKPVAQAVPEVVISTPVDDAASLVPEDMPQGPIPVSTLALPYRMSRVFRRLVPSEKLAADLLLNIEAMASSANRREPAFISANIGMDLLRGGDFPGDSMNILEHQVMDMLEKRYGLVDMEAVLDEPALIPLHRA